MAMTDTPIDAEAVERLREIAYRDEAKAVYVRADDLRAALTALASAREEGARAALEAAATKLEAYEGSLASFDDVAGEIRALDPAQIAKGDKDAG
jgi:hypothetical protein